MRDKKERMMFRRTYARHIAGRQYNACWWWYFGTYAIYDFDSYGYWRL